jgi:hypothetical protein
VIRRVAFRKAVLAGVVGALAWEAVIRALILLGLPLLDLVRLLGTMAVPQSRAWIWWPAGLALHATVGAIWAIFYAYFVWSTLDRPPAIQGLAFSLIPAGLAGLVMAPQLGWMHPLVLQGELPHPGLFGLGLGWGGPAGIVLGHLVYGLTMGSLYTRPVGYRVPRRAAVLHG